MTKQQKIYGAILFLAVGAWLIDRFLPSGGVTSPAAAGASSVLAPHTGGAAGGGGSPQAASVPTAKPPESLGDRLEQYAQVHLSSQKTVLDAFTPPGDWLAPAPAPSAPVAVAPAAATFDVEKFRHDHKLTAVIRSTEGDAIIMDGQVVQLGQQVGGLQLVETSPVSATFRAPAPASVQVILKLADGSDNKGAMAPNR